MISIPAVSAARGSAGTEAAGSSATNAGLFAQLLKARLDSSLMSLGTDVGSTSASGGMGSLMDVMFMGQMMQSASSASSGLDGALLQELIMQMKQPSGGQGTQTAPTETTPAATGGGIRVSRVYTPDILPTGSWPQHTRKHQSAAVSALTRVGDPYSQSRRGQGSYVDCSYLTQWAYAQNGISLPSIASEQARMCVEQGWVVPKSDLQIGDLVFWNRDNCSCGRYDEIHHVGIYLGDGQVVEASSSQGKVVINDLWGEEDDPPWHLAFFARPQA